MFKVLRELDDGELTDVSTHSDLEEAEAAVLALKEHWPGVYVIREIEDDQSE